MTHEYQSRGRADALGRQRAWGEDSERGLSCFLFIRIIKQMGIYTVGFHMETVTESGLERLKACFNIRMCHTNSDAPFPAKKNPLLEMLQAAGTTHESE